MTPHNALGAVETWQSQRTPSIVYGKGGMGAANGAGIAVSPVTPHGPTLSCSNRILSTTWTSLDFLALLRQCRSTSSITSFAAPGMLASV